MNFYRAAHNLRGNTLLKRTGIAILLCVASFSILSVYLRSSLYATPPRVLAACFATTTNPTLAATCLRNTMPDVLASNAVHEVMSYLVSTTTPQSIRRNCHPIGHVVGAETYKSTGSLEATLALCTGSCQYGCVHGAIAEAVLSEMGEAYPDEELAHADVALIAELGGRYCAQNAALCHGIGHLLYIGAGDIPDALEACDPVASGYAEEACFQGVFMEAEGGRDSLLLNPERPVIRDSNYLYPCSEVDAPFRHACFQFLPQYQSILFDQEKVVDIHERLAQAQRTCERLSGADRSFCIEGIGTQSGLFGFMHMNPIRMQMVCNRFATGIDRDSCTVGVIPRFIFAGGDLLQYCERIEEAPRQKLCFMTAYQAMGGRTNEALGISACTSEACDAAFEDFVRERETLPDYRFGLFGI